MDRRNWKSAAARLLAGLAVIVLVAWAAGEIWLASIGGSETELMRDLAAERSQGLIELARALTWLGSLWVLAPCGLVFCALLARAGLVIEAVALALGLLGAILIGDITKALVGRPRPPVEHLQNVSSPSFPSGHATQASAFWFSAALALHHARIRPRLVAAAPAGAVVIVVAVAWSRVYLGVHYPSDVTAGVLAGSAWALYVGRCLYRGASPEQLR